MSQLANDNNTMAASWQLYDAERMANERLRQQLAELEREKSEVYRELSTLAKSVFKRYFYPRDDDYKSGRVVWETLEDSIGVATQLDNMMAGLMHDAEQLAAIQAREQQLREYLHRLACLGNGEHYGTSDGNRIAQVALAIPQDTTALSSMIAKAGEVMRERCRKVAFDMASADSMAVDVSQSIRALPAVTLSDLK